MEITVFHYEFKLAIFVKAAISFCKRGIMLCCQTLCCQTCYQLSGLDIVLYHMF